MANKLEQAIALAERGFHLFPLDPNSKLPAVKAWQDKATRDPERLRKWFGNGHDHNIAIFTGRYGDDKALIAVDVDCKNGAKGYESLLQLELEGCELPRTYEQVTPTGGLHALFVADAPGKTGASVLGPGLDVRSGGGYVVAAGSTLGTAAYTANDEPPAVAPAWLIERTRAVHKPAASTQRGQPARVDRSAAEQRGVDYLATAAPAIAGQGGDEHTFKVAAALKDLGVAEDAALALLLEHWNDRCEPPWEADELAVKVRNAYAYGTVPPGALAPEAQFLPVETSTPAVHPLDALNARYAYVTAGGGHHILDQTTDDKGRPTLVHLSLAAFHGRYANKRIQIGKNLVPLSEAWMKSERRREFEGIAFRPDGVCPPRYFNLWRGFAFEPAATGQHFAVQMWIDHVQNNICGGDLGLSRWFIGHLAHVFQNPADKPLTAIILRGGKGVGKSSVFERVGALLGPHFVTASDRRYLTSNFNGHLENKLMFLLEEAFWSGDKSHEGILKHLITGHTHLIEHKGKEPYAVDNFTRVYSIGNDDWVAPASHDERRFAVFEVVRSAKHNNAFFERMRVGMENGGYAHFLRFFLDFDLTGLDFNTAPSTEGLLKQKVRSLTGVPLWWYSCLQEERILGYVFDGWPEEVQNEQLRQACLKFLKEQGHGWMPQPERFGHALRECCPSIRNVKKSNGRTYLLPSCAQARDEFSNHLGQEVPW